MITNKKRTVENKLEKKSKIIKAGKTNGTKNVEKSKFVKNSEVSNKQYWNEMKSKQKELKALRKKSKTKDLFELSVGAKKIYEKLKCKSSENKEELTKDLHKLLNRDNIYNKIVLTHDTTRVVQCMIKHASDEIRSEIADKLIPDVYKLSTSKYAHFCIARLLKFGSRNIRAKLINAMFKHIVKMSNHTFSNIIIDNSYLYYATNEQKAFMRQEFYSEMFIIEKNKNVLCLKDAWNNATYVKKSVLHNIKGHLVQAANKKLTDNSLLHAVLLEYLQESSETDRTEIITLYIPLLASISSTNLGSRAAILCFLHSPSKDRRAALKALKEFNEKLLVHEHGHTLILSILNSYDDTVMLNKTILSSVISNLQTIANSEWGRKVIAWIISPGDKTLFHPKLVESMDDCLKYGKKDKEVRRQEIFKSVSGPLCNFMAQNPKFWLNSGQIGIVTAAILKNVDGEPLKLILDNFASVICNPEWTVNLNEVFENAEEKTKPATGVIKRIKKSPFAVEKEAINKVTQDQVVQGIEHAGLHIILKRIAKLDKEKAMNNGPTFGEFIVKHLTPDTMKKWANYNRACFFLVMLYENGTDEVKEKIEEIIKAHKPMLLTKTHQGSRILSEKVKL